MTLHDKGGPHEGDRQRIAAPPGHEPGTSYARPLTGADYRFVKWYLLSVWYAHREERGDCRCNGCSRWAA